MRYYGVYNNVCLENLKAQQLVIRFVLSYLLLRRNRHDEEHLKQALETSTLRSTSSIKLSLTKQFVGLLFRHPSKVNTVGKLAIKKRLLYKICFALSIFIISYSLKNPNALLSSYCKHNKI